ncbi:MAG: DegT/DnrJ/EryC1/StrS family aminotransferase, partial [Cyanobacteria bacterium J06633_8]
YLDTWNQQRQEIAARYHELLKHVPGIIIPQELPGGTGVWNQYTIRVLDGKREFLQNQLKEKGVNTAVYYPRPLHLQPVYQSLGYHPGQLPAAEQACDEVLSLPMFPELSQEQQERVVYCIKEIMG